MTKYIVTVFAAIVSLAPAISSAQVGHINGNGNANQTLATTTGVTTMHMNIVTDQGVHTFQWDNTPWRVDQGGTGQSSFTSGALLVGNGTSPMGSVAPGNLGDILQFNGSVPTWVPVSSLGIAALPAGVDGEVQINDNGELGAASGVFGVRWDPDWGLSVYTIRGGNPLVFAESGTAPISGQISMNPGNITSTSVLAGQIFISSGNVTVSGDYSTVSSGGLSMDGGTVLSPLGSGSSGDIELVKVQCESGIGCTGGDIQLIPGRAANGSGGFNVGKIVFGSLSGFRDVAFDHSLLSANRTVFFPDSSGTFGLLEANQKWTGTNTFSKGAAATTTVNFGELGDATSHVCFNTKNTDGADISFYFVGTSMVVESNVCQ